MLLKKKLVSYLNDELLLQLSHSAPRAGQHARRTGLGATYSLTGAVPRAGMTLKQPVKPKKLS